MTYQPIDHKKKLIKLTECWSRQINKKDRIIYQIKNEEVTVFIVSAKGHYADIKQTRNNIKATRFKLGLLINFGTPSLSYKRIVN